jgi:hypothetical protein
MHWAANAQRRVSCPQLLNEKRLFMKKNLLFFMLLATASVVQAQYSSGPRLFLDLPIINLNSPNALDIGNRLGLGAGVAMNVATHWSTLRIGGGANVTMNLQNSDVETSLLTTPYALFEAGIGKYRSNGSQCAKTHQKAFTALAKGGVRYHFDTRSLANAGEDDFGLDYTVGGEFGYFFIRDIFRNFELFLDANYHIKAEALSANLGFKMFLNLRADRDR